MKCEIMRWHLTFEQQSDEHECEGCNHQKQMKNVRHHLIFEWVNALHFQTMK